MFSGKLRYIFVAITEKSSSSSAAIDHLRKSTKATTLDKTCVVKKTEATETKSCTYIVVVLSRANAESPGVG